MKSNETDETSSKKDKFKLEFEADGRPKRKGYNVQAPDPLEKDMYEANAIWEVIREINASTELSYHILDDPISLERWFNESKNSLSGSSPVELWFQKLKKDPEIAEKAEKAQLQLATILETARSHPPSYTRSPAFNALFQYAKKHVGKKALQDFKQQIAENESIVYKTILLLNDDFLTREKLEHFISLAERNELPTYNKNQAIALVAEVLIEETRRLFGGSHFCDYEKKAQWEQLAIACEFFTQYKNTPSVPEIEMLKNHLVEMRSKAIDIGLSSQMNEEEFAIYDKFLEPLILTTKPIIDLKNLKTTLPSWAELVKQSKSTEAKSEAESNEFELKFVPDVKGYNEKSSDPLEKAFYEAKDIWEVTRGIIKSNKEQPPSSGEGWLKKLKTDNEIVQKAKTAQVKLQAIRTQAYPPRPWLSWIPIVGSFLTSFFYPKQTSNVRTLFKEAEEHLGVKLKGFNKSLVDNEKNFYDRAMRNLETAQEKLLSPEIRKYALTEEGKHYVQSALNRL
jgi:hypothetical protein